MPGFGQKSDPSNLKAARGKLGGSDIWQNLGILGILSLDGSGSRPESGHSGHSYRGRAAFKLDGSRIWAPRAM